MGVVMVRFFLFSLTLSIFGTLVHSQFENVHIEGPVTSFPGQNGQVTFKVTFGILFTGDIFKSESRDFILDTSSSHFPLLSDKSCKSTKTLNFSFSGRKFDSFPESDIVVPISVSCTNKKKTPNVAALGSSTSSLHSQISKFTKLPSRFAYCLDHLNKFTQLSIGRTSYTLFYHSDILNSTGPLPFTRTSLAVNNQGGTTTYLLQLKKLSFNSESMKVKEIIQIGTTSRFTVLSSAAYDFVRYRVERASVKQKIPRVAARVGPLSLCYKMTSGQMNKFPEMSMELKGKAVWKIPPSNYLVPHAGSSDVYCFGFIKAGAYNSPSVIGTFQQENFYIEFDEAARTLRFTEPLVPRYQIGCSNGFGS